MVYYMTIMVDHCPAKKLLEHFLEFTEKINLNLKLMLHIGMDGRSVNLKFEDLLKSSPHLKSLGITILSIGTYPLHIVHNAFRAGVSALNFNINSFIIDVNSTNKCRNLPVLLHTLYRNIPAQDRLH